MGKAIPVKATLIVDVTQTSGDPFQQERPGGQQAAKEDGKAAVLRPGDFNLAIEGQSAPDHEFVQEEPFRETCHCPVRRDRNP